MIRIQLSSNYQVVELTYDNFDSMGVDDLETAVNLVNSLGNRIQVTPSPKVDDPPSEAQLNLCKKLHIDVKGKSKEEVRVLIKEKMEKNSQKG